MRVATVDGDVDDGSDDGGVRHQKVPCGSSLQATCLQVPAACVSCIFAGTG